MGSEGYGGEAGEGRTPLEVPPPSCHAQSVWHLTHHPLLGLFQWGVPSRASQSEQPREVWPGYAAWLQPGLWSTGENSARIKQVVLSRVMKGFLAWIYVGTKDYSAQPLCFSSHGSWNISGCLALLHHGARKTVRFNPYLPVSSLKPSGGWLLWGRLWRPDTQDLACDIFIKVYIFGLKCLLLMQH